jgi:MFS family permease
MPVIAMFYLANGLTVADITILAAVYSASLLLSEVVGGAFADHNGRRLALLVGTAINCLAFGMLGAAFSLITFIIGQVVMGMGASFISGSDEALLKASVRAFRRPRLGKMVALSDNAVAHIVGRYLARMHSARFIGAAASSIIGGVIAIWSLRATVVGQVVVYIPLLIIAWRLKEPPQGENKRGRKRFIHDTALVVKYALHGHKEVKWLILCGAVLGGITYPMVTFLQPYYQLVGVPLWAYGILGLVQFGLLTWFAMKATPRLKRRKRLPVFATLLGMGVGSYIVLGLAPYWWALLVMAPLFLIRAASNPLINGYILRATEEHMTATVLSVKNFAERLLTIVLLPVLGWLAVQFSLPTTLVITAGIFAFLSVATILAMRRVKLT